MRGHSVKSLPSPRTIDILQQYESTYGVRRRTWDTWGAESGALIFHASSSALPSKPMLVGFKSRNTEEIDARNNFEQEYTLGNSKRLACNCDLLIECVCKYTMAAEIWIAVSKKMVREMISVKCNTKSPHIEHTNTEALVHPHLLLLVHFLTLAHLLRLRACWFA